MLQDHIQDVDQVVPGEDWIAIKNLFVYLDVLSDMDDDGVSEVDSISVNVGWVGIKEGMDIILTNVELSGLFGKNIDVQISVQDY